MDVTFCFLAFTGLASLFAHGYIKATMELVSFVFLLYLGIHFLQAKSLHLSARVGTAPDKIEGRIKEPFCPQSAFLTGLVLVLGNPGVLVFWIVLAASFISHEWVLPDWPSKGACVAGAALGDSVWFASLSWVVSCGLRQFSERNLLWMQRLSGLGLLVLALVHGVTIIREIH
jgi:threonine/homoserine/homoserine lactone efflux protein